MPHEEVVGTDNNMVTKGEDLVRLIETDIMDRRVALEQRNYIRNLYFGLRRRKLRFKGQSNIHFHVLAEKIEALVPKEMNAFFAQEPHAHARRVPHDHNEAETKQAEIMVNHGVDTDIPNFYTTFESWIRNRHIDGVSVVKAWYNFEERRTVSVEETDSVWKAGDIDLTGTPVPEERLKLPVEILGSMFAGIQILDARVGEELIDPLQEQVLEGIDFLIDFVEDRVEYRDITVEFRPSRYINTINVRTFRPYPAKDNVEVDLIEFEDLIVPFRAKDLQSAPRVAQQYWLSMSEIEQRMQFEGWDITPEELVVLKNRSTTEQEEEIKHLDNSRLKKQKDLVTGQWHGNRRGSKTSKLPTPYSNDKVLIFEVYATDSLDGSGINQEMVYQIPYAIRRIVRAQNLEEVFPHGRRPFAELHSIPISNRFYSWSIGQILAPINVEVNTILNSVNDAQELINNPFFFYVPHAMPGDPKILQGLVPGQGIPVQDVNGVFFPKFQQEPLANLSAVDSLLLFADRLTVSPQASGSSQVRNAPRTARGTLALLSEAGVKVDGFITAAQKGGWGELMYQIYALYDAFASSEKWRKVTGTERPMRTRNRDLQDRVKFIFKGTTVNTNREVMRTLAQSLYQLLAAEPMYATDMVARRNLIEFLLNQYSDGGIDVQKLLPRAQEQGGSRQPLSQRAETEMMKQGMPVNVLPIDDDASHMAEINALQNGKAFENLTDLQVTLIAAHFKQHQDQLMLKQQQGQIGGGGGTANNVPSNIVGAGSLSGEQGGIQ